MNIEIKNIEYINNKTNVFCILNETIEFYLYFERILTELEIIGYINELPIGI